MRCETKNGSKKSTSWTNSTAERSPEAERKEEYRVEKKKPSRRPENIVVRSLQETCISDEVAVSEKINGEGSADKEIDAAAESQDLTPVTYWGFALFFA